jgi:hypothetical protein
MSLAGAIEALRKAVPLVPPAENRTEPMEAAPVGAVPPVPGVPSEKSRGEKPVLEASWENTPDLENENGEVSDSSLSRNRRNATGPLSDAPLAELFTRAARRFNLVPADLWAFLSLGDIEAIRTGRPDELRALWAFAESRSLTGERITGGHDLPFPGAIDEPAGLQRVACGDCAHFRPDTVGDGSGIGDCGKGIEARGWPRYPRIERYCREYVERR